MNAPIIKLKFTSPFHLNPPGDGLHKTETAISSDMLISALAICHSKLYGYHCDDFFTGKLRVSSLFPFYKDTLFFPVPLFDFRERKVERIGYKKLSKLKYLEKDLWMQVIDGKKLDPDAVHPQGVFGISSKRVNNPDENQKIPGFFFEQELQRLGDDPFYYSQVRLAPEAGMFFIYHVDSAIESQFKACLRLLADEGIGGDRTVGKGLFEIIEETSITFPENSTTHYMNLSFYIPSETDLESIDLTKSYYRLQHKRGWYVTHRVLNLKKKGIFGFGEGSVFASDRELTGKTVTLLDRNEMAGFTDAPFEILRNGYMVGIPVQVPRTEGD